MAGKNEKNLIYFDIKKGGGMDFTFRKSGEAGVLMFEGKFSNEREEEFKAAMMLALNNAKHVVLHLDKDAEADPSCLKMLRLVYRASANMNKRITLVGENMAHDLVKQEAGIQSDRP